MGKGKQFISVKTVMNLSKKLVRNDTLQGRDYLVVPMVMLVEGVHAGSEGAYLYSAAELSKHVEVWNRKPVVVYHPDPAVSVTACSKEVLNSRGIGDIMNAKWDKKEKRLLAEAWLDEERMKKVDPRVLEAIQNEETLELSTGLFADSDEAPGEWEGEEFIGTLSNYGPDHLAVLPDQVGACSVEDGAGFFRNSGGTKVILSKSWMQYFNELSHNSVRDLLQKAIAQKGEYRYVEDVFDSTFVWSNDLGMWQQDYKESNNTVSVSGIPLAVVRRFTYEPVTSLMGTNQNKNVKNKTGERSMSKTKLVSNLIAHTATPWEEDDREYLMNLSEARLESLQPKAESVTTPTKDAPVQNTPVQTPVTLTPPTPLTEAEYKAQMPPTIRNRMERLERMEAEEQTRLIGVIKKNPKNTFSEDWLKTQDIEMLQNLANISETDSTGKEVRRFNYSMQGNPVQNSKDPVAGVPVLNTPGDVKPSTKAAAA